MTERVEYTTADLVFQNGSVYRRNGLWDGDAVAVAGGRILNCGCDAGQLISQATRVVDLRGGSLVPGLQDSHAQPMLGGAALLGIDFSPVHSHPEYLTLISAYALSHQDTAVLQGVGW